MAIYKITTKENEILFTCHVETTEACVDDMVNKVNHRNYTSFLQGLDEEKRDNFSSDCEEIDEIRCAYFENEENKDKDINEFVLETFNSFAFLWDLLVITEK